MKLNPDLLREIMFALEEDPNRFNLPARKPVDGHTWEETEAHLCPLIELEIVRGFVCQTTADPVDGPTKPVAMANGGLTARGQMIAMEMHDDTLWKRSKERAGKVALAVTTAAVGQVVSYFLKGADPR